MTPQEFIAKWEAVTISERSACQQHFLDLCDLFDHPKPAAADPTGESFTFERGAILTRSASTPTRSASEEKPREEKPRQGWADVWKKGFFGPRFLIPDA